MLKDKNEIKNWLDKMQIKDYKINLDNTVDVSGFVGIRNSSIIELPIQFASVNGDFDIAGNDLTSMKGFPYRVSGNVYADNNKITSLKYCPKNIGKKLVLSLNPIEEIRLEYLPETVGKYLCFEHPDNKKIAPFEDYYEQLYNGEYVLERELDTIKKVLLAHKLEVHLEAKIHKNQLKI